MTMAGDASKRAEGPSISQQGQSEEPASPWELGTDSAIQTCQARHKMCQVIHSMSRLRAEFELNTTPTGGREGAPDGRAIKETAAGGKARYERHPRKNAPVVDPEGKGSQKTCSHACYSTPSQLKSVCSRHRSSFDKDEGGQSKSKSKSKSKSRSRSKSKSKSKEQEQEQGSCCSRFQLAASPEKSPTSSRDAASS